MIQLNTFIYKRDIHKNQKNKSKTMSTVCIFLKFNNFSLISLYWKLNL